MPRVPNADETRNILELHAIGNKSDAAVGSVGTAASIMAYVKGILSAQSGDGGLTTFPPAAIAADGVSIAEVVRWISEHQSTVILNKATAALPQGADASLFTITAGNILLEGIIGEVTTVIETQANASRLKFNPTGTGADVNLCATLDITADAVGTFYSLTGTLTDPLQSNLWYGRRLAAPIVLGPGVIELECADSNTGSVEWHLMYSVVDAAAEVAAVVV